MKKIVRITTENNNELCKKKSSGLLVFLNEIKMRILLKEFFTSYYLSENNVFWNGVHLEKHAKICGILQKIFSGDVIVSMELLI